MVFSNTLIQNEFQTGECYIPEKVVISLPRNEEVLMNRIQSDEVVSNLENIKSANGSIKTKDNSTNLFIGPNDQVFLYVNVKSETNYNIVVKKTTASNSFLEKMNRFSAVSPIILKNEGFMVKRIIDSHEVSGGSAVEDSTTDSLCYALVEITHPDLYRVVNEKLGYDLSKYKNISIITYIKYTNLIGYLARNRSGMSYGRLNEPIRFADTMYSESLGAAGLIHSDCLFISESDYQKNKDTFYKISRKLGESCNLLGKTDPYKLGHLYYFSPKSSKINISYFNRFGYYFLYVGKINLGKYRAVKSRMLFDYNIYIDRWYSDEFSEWDSESDRINRKKSRWWGDIEIPLDVFVPVAQSSSYSRSNLNLLDENSVIKKYIEQDVIIPEDEFFELKADSYLNIYELNKKESESSSNDEGFMCERTNPMFLVFPSAELTEAKKESILELDLFGFDKDNVGSGFYYSPRAIDFVSSYRHFSDVIDLGKVVEFSSFDAKVNMKRMIVDIFGKKGDYFKVVCKEIGDSDSECSIGVESFNLFTEDELQQLPEDVLNNLRTNLADLIINLLTYFCRYIDEKLRNTWTCSYRGSTDVPEIDSFKGIPKSLFNGVSDLLKDVKDFERIEGKAMAEKKKKAGFVDIAVNSLLKAQEEPSELMYRKNSLVDLIKKFNITEKMLRKCEAY